MFRHKQTSLAIMALCAGGIATTAVAQQQQPPAQPQTLQRVEVTGSNIKRIDAESVAPVQIITRDQIQRSGQPTIADVLRNIPANTGGSFGENFTNSFAPGSSGISLRGLGEKTTLVLINGRRTSNYGFAQNLQDSFVDLNSIPTSAVERVEILKDGASAIYGSDAIAGVVNIILRKDYKGFEVSGGGGRASGKNEYNGTLTGGFGDLGSDKFNVFGVLDFYHRDLIELSDTPFGKSRDYRGQPGGRNFTSLASGGTWRQLDPVTGALTNTFKASTSCFGKVITGTEALAQGLTTSAAQGAATNTFCSKDFNDQFTAEPKTDRIGFLGRGTYEFSPNVSAYLEVGLSRVKSFSTFQNAFFAGTTGLESTPAGLVPFSYNVTFAPGVAGNPFATNARYSGVNTDLGTRNNDVTSDTGRFVAGLTYTLGTWDLDSAAGYSRNSVKAISQNNLSLAGTSAAFGVPTTPQPPVPVSTASTYNLDDNTQNSAAVRQSMLIDSPRKATSTLYFIDTKASTEFQQIKLPGGPLGLAVGAEYRRESLNDRPDAASTNGEILGLGTTATDGSRNSQAIYAELRLPILKNLEMQVAGRYDHYSDYGGSATPKVGLKYTPTDTIALRANYGRGFRAPSLPEISPSSATFFTQVIDPQTGEIANISGKFVGNPKLKAEKSTSLNYGIVFQPTKDLSASLDFYRIRWNNIVGAPSFQQTVDDACPNPPQADGDPPCPSSPNVVRNPEDNAIVTVLTGYENISSRVTSGLDMDLTYAIPTVSLGKFTAHLDANYLLKFVEDGTSTNDSNSGFNTIPRLKASASLDWDYSAFKFTGRWNYTKGWTQAALPGSYFAPQNPAFQTGVYRDKTPDYYTFDIFGSYQVTKNFSVNGSVVNLFNRKPPYDPGFSGTFLYDFSEFDARGRLYRVNLTYKM
ncbi:MAG: TonB-dependent receptor [Caldimonas sp.]